MRIVREDVSRGVADVLSVGTTRCVLVLLVSLSRYFQSRSLPLLWQRERDCREQVLPWLFKILTDYNSKIVHSHSPRFKTSVIFKTRYYPFSTPPPSITTIEGQLRIYSLEILQSLSPQIKSPLHIEITSPKVANVFSTNITQLELRCFIPFTPGNQYLPPYLTCLVLGRDVKLLESLVPGSLPSTLRHLILGKGYIEPGSIPNSVTHLQIGYNGGQPYVPGVIPDSVAYLKLYDINSPIGPGVIPSSVTHLIGGKGSIFLSGSIPNSVTHIDIDQLDQVELPSSIVQLRTSFAYGSEERLKRRRDAGDNDRDIFIFTIDNISPLNPLPISLPAMKLYNPLRILRHFSGHNITITIDDHFFHRLINKDCVRLYDWGYCCGWFSKYDNVPLQDDQALTDRYLVHEFLPKNYYNRTRYYPFSTPPPSITTIEGLFRIYSPEILQSLSPQIKSPLHIEILSPKVANVFTTNITQLELHCYIPFTPGNQYLPQYLTCLVLGPYHKLAESLVPGSLPSTLRHLILGVDAKETIKVGILPQSITHLVIGKGYIEPGSIPNSVTHLQIGYNGGQPYVPGVIPDSVTYLKFRYLNSPIGPDVIPSSVTNLIGGKGSIFLSGSIPNSVTHIDIDQLDQVELPSSIVQLRTSFAYGSEERLKRRRGAGDNDRDIFIFTIDNISPLNPLPLCLPAMKLHNPLRILRHFSGHNITITIDDHFFHRLINKDCVRLYDWGYCCGWFRKYEKVPLQDDQPLTDRYLVHEFLPKNYYNELSY
eukprot:gene17104-20373_t